MPWTMSARNVSKGTGSVVYPAHNDLPAEARSSLIDLLDERLADAVDLQTQMKQAHWNVKGPTFFQLHELFDKINEDAEEYVDLIAERAVQLGGLVHGTARQSASRSTLPEYPLVKEGRQHVDAVTTALAAFGRNVRAAIDRSEKLGDKDTADIFTEISRGVDKWLWFVEAHLHAER
jgi:starvation-inducible DNA-binding protein